MKEGLKAAAVFIGTVIGAGFATGQEVALYFGKSAPIVAIVSGLLLGALCAFFMYLGSLAAPADDVMLFLPERHRVLSNSIVFICAYISFIAMFSGAEVLIMSTFSIAHTGIFTVIAAAFVAATGLKRIKLLNVLAVPLIVVMTAVIFFKNGNYAKGGNYNFFNSIAYAAMNIMLAAGVMARLGRGASKKTIKTAGVASGLTLAVLLCMITLTVSGVGGDIPMFAVAKRLGLSYLSGGIIFLAIFTTMVSAIETAAECMLPIVPDKRLSVLTVCLMAYPAVILLSFSQIVNYFYPIVSLFGALLIIFGAIDYFKRKSLRIV